MICEFCETPRGFGLVARSLDGQGGPQRESARPEEGDGLEREEGEKEEQEAPDEEPSPSAEPSEVPKLVRAGKDPAAVEADQWAQERRRNLLLELRQLDRLSYAERRGRLRALQLELHPDKQACSHRQAHAQLLFLLLRRDAFVVLAALAQEVRAMEFAGDELTVDRTFAKSAVWIQGMSLKYFSADAALEEERQLGQREREVMAERLRFAQSEDEAARERLSRALASLRGRAREGATEAAVQQTRTEAGKTGTANRAPSLSQVSHAAFEQEAASLKHLQREQSAQLALVSAERERLSEEVKKLKEEGKNLELQAEQERKLKDEMSERERLMKALAAARKQKDDQVGKLQGEIAALRMQATQRRAEPIPRVVEQLGSRSKRLHALRRALRKLRRGGRFTCSRVAATCHGPQDWDPMRTDLKDIPWLQQHDLRTAPRPAPHAGATCGAALKSPHSGRRSRSPAPGEGEARGTGMLELRCQELQSRLERALLDADASRQRTLELELQLECERGDSRAQQLRPSFLARSAVLGVQSTKGGQVKRGCSVGKAEGMLRLQEPDPPKSDFHRKSADLEKEMTAARAQARAAKVAEETAMEALSDSERRCRDGLRRMDAMLTDTKELTRELAKHKYLAQGMDSMAPATLDLAAGSWRQSPERPRPRAVRSFSDFRRPKMPVEPITESVRFSEHPRTGQGGFPAAHLSELPSFFSDPGTSRFGVASPVRPPEVEARQSFSLRPSPFGAVRTNL
eukprot:g33607.t1